MIDATKATGAPSLVAHAYYMRSVAETSIGNPQRRHRARGAVGRRRDREREPDRAGAGRLRPRRVVREHRSRPGAARCSTAACSTPSRSATAGSAPSRSPRACGSAPSTGDAKRGAGAVPRRDRHLVPRRRLGQPVAVVAPRVRDLRSRSGTTRSRRRSTARSTRPRSCTPSRSSPRPPTSSTRR